MMKKTKYFIISSIVLLLLGYVSLQYVYTHADFKIHTMSGNSDILNDITMKVTFNTPKAVDVLYKNQEVTYQIITIMRKSFTQTKNQFMMIKIMMDGKKSRMIPLLVQRMIVNYIEEI